MHLGTISNPDPIVDGKVKHFYDYINYILSNNRNIISSSYVNHLSFLEGLTFRVDHNVYAPSTWKVINYYLNKNSLFNTKDDFYSRKGTIKKILGSLKTQANKKEKNEDFDKNLKIIISELNGKDGLEGKKYFKSILSEIIKMLQCDCPLNTHKSEIEYFTRLLIAEFFRVGFLKRDLDNSSGFLRRILSRRFFIEEDENDFYSDFPLSDEVESYRYTDKFKDKVEEYIESLTFTKQFEGLYLLFSKKNRGRFIFKITNIADDNTDLNIEFGDVKLFHRNSFIVNTDTWDEDFIDRFYKFTNEENTCLAEVNLIYKSIDNGKQEALRKVKETIDLLNYVAAGTKIKTVSKGCVLETEICYILYEKGARFLFNHDKISLSNYKLNDSLKTLYPKKFYNLPIKTQEIVKLNDKIFFRASTSNSWDDQVGYFWRYLESYFPDKNQKVHGEKIISNLAYILLLKEFEIQKGRLEYTIYNILNNTSLEVLNLNISRLEVRTLTDNWSKTKKGFEKFKELSTYPFYTEKYQEYEKLESNLDYKKIREFYLISLWEVYEQRNMIFHQNISCPITLEKLIDLLPQILRRFRSLLIDELIINDKSIEDTLKTLIEKGRKLL